MNCCGIEFIELSSQILDRGNCLRFQAKGNSMFPVIKHSDILTIEPIMDKEIYWADILFFKAAGGHIVAHRLVKKILQDKELLLVTKGDFLLGNDEKIRLKDVLGRVKSIERNGQVINLTSGMGKWLNLLFAVISPLIIEFREIAGNLLRLIQGLSAYRRLAKRLIKKEIVYRYQSVEFPNSYLLAKVGNKIIGRVKIDCFTKQHYLSSGWWISGMWVNWRYRGIGIAERLTKMLFDFAGNQGAPNIKLLVFKNNKAAINLYRKMGFQPISNPRIDQELKIQAEKVKRPSIAMVKYL